MSGQPANTDISIYRTVRAYRQDLRHESVEALIKRLRPLVMSVPGREVLTGVLYRDTAVTDFSPYMGQASVTATRGFPIVIGIFPTVTFAEAQEGLTDIDFAFTIGGDRFLHNTAAGLPAEDLQGDLRTLYADNLPAGELYPGE